MEPKQQLGTIVLAITVAAAFLIVGTGDVLAQDDIEFTITDIQEDAPGDDHENLNGESVTILLERDGRTLEEIQQAPGVNVSGYTLDYGDGNVYELDADTLSFGTSLTIHTGNGQDYARGTFPPSLSLYANFSHPVLDNTANTVTLRNAEGEVVAQQSYDSGNGKTKQDSRDGGNGKAKMNTNDDDADDSAANGGNGKAKQTTTTTDTTITTTDTTAATTDTTTTDTTITTTDTTAATTDTTTTDTTTTTVGNEVDAVANGFSIVGVVAVLGILSVALLFRRES